MLKLTDIFNQEKDKKKLKFLLLNVETDTAIQKIWPKVLTGAMANDCWYGGYKDGKLVIFTQNPCWITEINFHRQIIIDKVNTLIKKKLIRYVQVTLNKQKPQDLKPDDEKKEDKLNPPKDLSFKDKIKWVNTEKERLGYKPCRDCDAVLTQVQPCVFCQSQNHVLL